MRSDAATVKQYLSELPMERQRIIAAVRRTILDNLPRGYEEAMNWGMITYQVPLDVYPETYNGQPLMYAALAAQKNHNAVYLSAIYMDDERRKAFETAYRATGQRLDFGKSCVRFRTLDDLPLPLIGAAIASLDVQAFIRRVEATAAGRKQKPLRDAPRRG